MIKIANYHPLENRIDISGGVPALDLANELGQDLIWPILDESPGTDIATVSGRLLRCNDLGQCLGDRYRRGMEILFSEIVRIETDNGVAALAYSSSYQVLQLQVTDTMMISNVHRCQEDGTLLASFYAIDEYQVSAAIPTTYIVNTGPPGGWADIRLTYLG